MKRHHIFALTAVMLSACITGGCGIPQTNPPDTAASAAEPESVFPFAYHSEAPQIFEVSNTEKEIEFYRDGGIRLHGELILPEGEGPFPTVVFAAGLHAPYTDHYDKAGYFAGYGYASLLFDFYGTRNGTSDGDPADLSFFTEAADLNTVLDALPDLPDVDTDQVFLYGHSFGGLVSTYVACKRSAEIKGMMQAEPSYQMYLDYYEALGCGERIADEIRAADLPHCLPHCKTDAVIFMGTDDFCIGAVAPECLTKPAALMPLAEVVTIEGADHFFSGKARPALLRQALAFLQAHTAS